MNKFKSLLFREEMDWIECEETEESNRTCFIQISTDENLEENILQGLIWNLNTGHNSELHGPPQSLCLQIQSVNKLQTVTKYETSDPSAICLF